MRTGRGGTTRRGFMRETLGWGLGGALLGRWLGRCPRDSAPPISWPPTVLAPVFYGYQDVDTNQGAPVRLRVFYPSLDGAALNAPMLTCVGRYPLVALLHGDCGDPNDYKDWFLLPAVLARCGFIVVVPDLSWGGGQYPWAANAPQYDVALDVIDWARSSWSGSEWVSSSALALVGHSFGALLASRLAVDVANDAYVSIGGGWAEWDVTIPVPIYSLGVPSLLLYGSADTYAAPPSFDWARVPAPTHRIVFDGGDHGDHIEDTTPTCGGGNGPCDLVNELTADLTALFLSKIMRVGTIPESLEPPAFSPNGDQIFYAGNHLTSFSQLPRVGCTATIEWNTSVAGSVVLPW